MKQFLLIVSVLTMVGTQVSAAFMQNRQAWNEVGEAVQAGYVQGVFSEMTQRIEGDSKSFIKMKEAIHACAFSMKLKTKDLMKMVDKHYEDLENWDTPAHLALRQSLFKVCKNVK